MAKCFQTIVVPTDFSDPARYAVGFAMDLLREGGTLHCIHVVDDVPLSYGYVGMTLPADDLRSRLAASAEGELQAFLPAGIDMHQVETHVLHGSPHVQIVDFARKCKADLIAMGTHGRTGIEHALLGSVAEKVLRRSPCPVLVIREGGVATSAA